MFIAFYNQRYSQQSIDRCQPPPTNVKHLEPTNPWEVFANSWICLTKRPCLNFDFSSCVDSLPTIGGRHWRKAAAMFEKAESANSLLFAVPFHVGAYFCMGAYKRDVVVIKMGAYIQGVLILCGCLLSRIYGSLYRKNNWCFIRSGFQSCTCYKLLNACKLAGNLSHH